MRGIEKARPEKIYGVLQEANGPTAYESRRQEKTPKDLEGRPENRGTFPGFGARTPRSASGVEAHYGNLYPWYLQFTVLLASCRGWREVALKWFRTLFCLPNSTRPPFPLPALPTHYIPSYPFSLETLPPPPSQSFSSFCISFPPAFLLSRHCHHLPQPAIRPRAHLPRSHLPLIKGEQS